MAGLIKPILNKFQSLAQSNINTEKDVFDNTLPDIASAAIVIEHPSLRPEMYPWICIYPQGESDVDSEDENVNVIIPWKVIVCISVTGTNSEDLINRLDVYSAAFIYAVIKNGGWNLDGTCDVLRLTKWAHESFEGEEEGDIILSGFLEWEPEKEYTIE